jgi:hypothetical protein
MKPQKMDEIRETKLCFNYDNKYCKGNTFSEKKAIYREEEEYQEMEHHKIYI